MWLYNPGRKLAPTPKQLEFHAAGGIPGKRFIALGAGNQEGKTFGGAMEIAFHMTGLYPEWWEGYRFPGPTMGWIAGVTGESTKDNPQRTLLGEKRYWGTGTIPKASLFGDPVMARGGVPDSVDSFETNHTSGGRSIAWFKSYAEGREKWQGRTLDWIWFDEEPPEDIWNEGLARLMKKMGIARVTFTPLKGMSKVVSLFYEPERNPARDQYHLVNMNLDDAIFYTKEQRESLILQWSEAERRARVLGLPLLGEGLVLPVLPNDYLIEPFDIPQFFRRIIGLDVGVGHPTAAAFLAYNPDTDTVYVYDEYKHIDPLIATHATSLSLKGAKIINVAWPHDALKSNPNSGENIKDIYSRFDIKMLPESARYHDDTGGGQPIEPIINTLLERIKTGRFKVFSHLSEWRREQGSWHRKDGKPVDFMDDLMKATLYGLMSLRYARPSIEMQYPTQAQSDYDPLQDNWYGTS
jgi:phage terminase large subunit-like protein